MSSASRRTGSSNSVARRRSERPGRRRLIDYPNGPKIFGRGSWIRTNDLQYPKLPRYQAALYPDFPREDVDTRSERWQQGTAISLNRTANWLRRTLQLHAISLTNG